jgi:hypothetical protein
MVTGVEFEAVVVVAKAVPPVPKAREPQMAVAASALAASVMEGILVNISRPSCRNRFVRFAYPLSIGR